MGAVGLRVDHARDFAPTLAKALAVQGRPVVIDVVTDIEAIAPAAVT
jgi:acetolactate synthase I/II/III large subunit